MTKSKLVFLIFLCFVTLTGCAETKVELSQSEKKVCDDLRFKPVEGEPILVRNSSEFVSANTAWWTNYALKEQPDVSLKEFSDNQVLFKEWAIENFNLTVKSVAQEQYLNVEDELMASLLEQIYDSPTETLTDNETYEIIAPLYNKVLDLCELWEVPQQ
jgi:hypothetical protein